MKCSLVQMTRICTSCDLSLPLPHPSSPALSSPGTSRTGPGGRGQEWQDAGERETGKEEVNGRSR